MGKSTLVAICQAMAKNAPNGLPFETVAKFVTGRGYPALASELSQQPGHKLGAETMLQLMKASEGREPMHFMARELGGIFVELAPIASGMHCLTRGMAECVKEFGEFIVEVANSLEDGTITSEELERIGSEGQEALTAILKVMELAKRSMTWQGQKEPPAGCNSRGSNSRRSNSMSRIYFTPPGDVKPTVAEVTQRITLYHVRIDGRRHDVPTTHRGMLRILPLMMGHTGQNAEAAS